MKERKDVSKVNHGSKRKPKGAPLKWYWNVVGALVFGSIGFFMLIPLWDSLDVQTVRCEVVSAKGDTSSGGIGGSASTAGVLVETSNCGTISVSSGVTFDSQDKVAASFAPGNEYDFDIGWYSRVVTKGLQHGIQSARDYRLVH